MLFYSNCKFTNGRRGVPGDGRERKAEQERARAWRVVLQRGAADPAVHLQQARRGAEVKTIAPADSIRKSKKLNAKAFEQLRLSGSRPGNAWA